MQTSLTFGRVSGIPLKVHLNWFLTAALVTWSLGAGYFPYQYPYWEKYDYWSTAVLTALLFFGSVLLHELGHSLVAQREGVRVRSITLFIFGGVAHIANEPPSAGAEFRIVAAGPFTSLVLAAGFYTLGAVDILGIELSSAALYISQMNLILAIFNLLPGFPLDGGRVLRSALWKITGNLVRATFWASVAGIGMALLFIGSGIVLVLSNDVFSGIWVAFIGGYLGIAAREGYRQAKDYEQIMESDFDEEEFELEPNLNSHSKPAIPLNQKAQSYASTFVFFGLARRPTRPSPFVEETQPCSPDNRSEVP